MIHFYNITLKIKSINLWDYFSLLLIFEIWKRKTFFFSERHSYVDSSETMSPASLKGRNNYHIGSSSYSSMLATKASAIHNIASHYCNLCPERFITKNDLKVHFSQVHGDQMRYTCSLCGKGYKTSSGLKSHIEAHEGKTFDCPICNCKLTQKSNMRTHMKLIHKATLCLKCNEIVKLDQLDLHICANSQLQ